MSVVKKFKKLIHNPSGFWRDSSFNPKNKIYNTRKNSPDCKINVIDYDINVSIFDALKNSLKNCSNYAFYYFPIHVSHKKSICISSNHRKDFALEIENLIDSGWGIKYKKKGQLVDFLNASDFLENLLKSNKFDIRFEDNSRAIWIKIEVWSDEDEYFVAPAANHLSRKLWKHCAEEKALFKAGHLRNLSCCFDYKNSFEFDFDVDLVFTWVNSNDENWKAIYSKYRPLKNTDATGESRFFSRDELKFAIRSWHKYGNFIRKIFIVSNCAAPEWLDLSNEKIEWIWHEDIFDKEHLPTFSSHAIEANLHKIPGLSNYFIYSNDDFLLVREADKSDFFYPNGICKAKFEAWGNVNAVPRIGDPDYLNGARNSNSLLEQEFFRTTTALHTHSPQAMRKDILEEMQIKYAEVFYKTSSNKFRAVDDVSVTGYFYSHYAYLTGRAVPSDTATMLIQQNHEFIAKFKKLLLLKKNSPSKLPLSICVNDGADSHKNAAWNRYVELFLKDFFKEKSIFEL